MSKENLVTSKISWEAIQYARSMIRCGYTWTEVNSYEPEERSQLYEKVEQMRKDSIPKETSFTSEFEKTSEKIRCEIEQIEKKLIGNCYELALIAMQYLSKTHHYAEIFCTDGDHCFVVIDRIKGSNPDNPLEWGEDCYICDPFTQKTFPATKYVGNLKDLTEQCGLNYLRDFDPEEGRLLEVGISTEHFCKLQKTNEMTEKDEAVLNKEEISNEKISINQEKVKELIQKSLVTLTLEMKNRASEFLRQRGFFTLLPKETPEKMDKETNLRHSGK